MNWISVLKLSLCIFLGTSAFAQQNSLWFKADPSVFTNPSWEVLTKEFNLTLPVQALPASRNPELQKVYEVQGDCDLTAFKSACSIFGDKIYSIERGPTYTPLFAPNDLNFQAGISDYALTLINAPQAWDLTQGNDSVVIAISDQNFEITHQDLEGKYLYYDATNTAPTTHGTAVAITAAGKTNNGYGLSSIGFNTSLSLYKMNFNEVLAASYAGADVINISWTSGCFYSQLEQDVMDEVSANGSFIVAAAGNGNTCGLPDALVYPASYNHVFSVTSVGPSNNHEQWIGDPSSTHNHNDSVDLAAPGYDVAISPASGWYLNMNGTSFAAAFVSGTVALMLSTNKCISNLQIEQILKNTASPLNSLNPAYAGKLGAGRLDAFQAVLAASTAWNPITPSFLIVDSCLAQDASITLLIQGAQAPFDVVWGNNVTGVFNPNLNTNTYTVHIEGTHGCRLDTAVFVNDVIPPTYTAIQADPLCADSYNGGIQLNVTNNITTSVLWSEGSVGTQLSGLGAGTYVATLSYGNGCSIQQAFTLIATSAILATGIVMDETVLNNGAINLTANGGVAPYSFLWNTNEASEDLTSLGSGWYEVLITDANGCQVVDSFQVQNLMNAESPSIDNMVLSLYPNPNDGSFNVSLPTGEIFETRIYDAQGRVVFDASLEGNQSLILPLASGKYLAQFVSTSTQKHIILPFVVN
jgi:hypothetical protein